MSALALMASVSGCASYRDLPAGTHQQVSGKQEPDVVREVVDLSPNPSTPPVAIKTNDYYIGTNDILYVAVNGRLDFDSHAITSMPSATFKGYRVDGRGCIYLPLAGKVEVAGLSLAEARNRIDVALHQYFKDRLRSEERD